MAHDDQARDSHEQGNSFSKADTCSMASFGSSSFGDDSSVADGDDGDKGKGKNGQLNLAMSDLLNQPPPSSVNITNSTDVRVGPSLHYNGPVTINQFLNLQQHGAAGLEDIPVPLNLLTDGTGKGVLSGVAASGVGVGAEASKRGGGDSAGATGAPWWQRPKLLVAVGSLVVLLAGVATIVALLWPKSGQRLNIPTDPPPDPELLLEDGRQIIRRSKWSDIPPDSRRRLHHPTPYVIIAHTAGTACRGELECFPLLCSYRDKHRAKWKQPDISYNFLIDVEGNVYEGRGWNATNNFQSWATRCNLAVAFMGNFMNDKVTLAMATSLERLLKLGVALSKLDKNYRLLAHDQVLATLSPGRNVLDLIKDWPHRCLSSCSEGVQCIQEDTTEVSPALSGSTKSGKR